MPSPGQSIWTLRRSMTRLQTPKGRRESFNVSEETTILPQCISVPFNTQADIELPLDCIACLEENQEVLWRRAENMENTETVFLRFQRSVLYFGVTKEKEKRAPMKLELCNNVLALSILFTKINDII